MDTRADHQGGGGYATVVLSIVTQSSISRKGDSVDKITEAVWCEHVKAEGVHLPVTQRALRLSPKQESIYIVPEEGKIKVMCNDCFVRAVQVPMIVRES